MTRDGDAKETGKGKGKKADERPDGDLTPDELAERRAAKANGNGSASIAQRAKDGEVDGDEPELFPLGTLSGDPKRTIRNLIKTGAKVTTQVSMTRAAVPNPSGGLFDPEEEVEVLVRVLPGQATQAPTHIEGPDGKHRVKEWKISQELRVIHVQPAGSMFTEEQVVEMLEAVGAPAATISKLLGHEEGTGTQG